MTTPFRSGFIPAEIVRDMPDVAAAALLEEERHAQERALREEHDRRNDAQIIADERAKKIAQLRAFEERTAPHLDRCDDCGKTRSVEQVSARYRRFSAVCVSPVDHCSCPDGPVQRADAWSIQFIRDAREGFALAFLFPASKVYSPIKLRPLIAASDLEAQQHMVPGSGFEWADISNASRRLAFTILALVANPDRADRWADAYMREVLAVTIAKNAQVVQSVTLGDVRRWLTSHEAAGAAA